MKKVKMNVGGQSVEVEKMSFDAIKEAWCLYRLEDGTTFKMKPVVMDVFRLPTLDPVTGYPQLMIQTANVVSVEPSDTPSSKEEVQ